LLGSLRYYLDAKIKWRWRLKAPNGRIIADSAESYEEGSECRAAIDRVIKYCKADPPTEVV
jgi:uncharacterized protein YegP (UPF0339 family)